MTDGLHHPTHFAITPLRDRDAIPAVGALSTAIFNGPERSHAIVQANALQKALLLFVTQSAQHPDCVLAFQTKARMHQLVCQLARAGKQKQPFCVEVEPAYRLPFAVLQTRQLAEHSGSVLRVIMRHHLANRLVIGDHTRWRRIDAIPDGLSIDFDLVAKLDTLPYVRWLVVDGDTPFQDELLHFKARTKTRLRQNLVQLGRFDLRLQHPFDRQGLSISPLVTVKAPGYNVSELIALRSLALSRASMARLGRRWSYRCFGSTRNGRFLGFGRMLCDRPGTCTSMISHRQVSLAV